MKEDLNKLQSLTSGYGEESRRYRDLQDYHVAVTNAAIECHFRHLEPVIVEKILEADAVVGCVAWLTSEPVLRALSTRKYGVSIVVQKEDFLRPDLGDTTGFAERMRRLYNSLKAIEHPNWLAGCFERRGCEDDPGAPGVDISIRCVGHRRSATEITLPRMHHKFLVFCRYSINEELAWPYIPYAVWTGSFNITKNGSRSLENAVYIQHPEVAMHYFFEWQQILEVSETLDWTSPYAAPDIQFNDGAVFS